MTFNHVIMRACVYTVRDRLVGIPEQGIKLIISANRAVLLLKTLSPRKTAGDCSAVSLLKND